MKARSVLAGVLCLGSVVFGPGCKTPPVPPEAERARALGAELGRAGGAFYAFEETEAYRRSLVELNARLEAEGAKFAWFRDYGRIADAYRRLLDDGEAVLAKIDEVKTARTRDFEDAAGDLDKRLRRLDRITRSFNESDGIRHKAALAEIKLAEARLLREKEKFDEAGKAMAAGLAFVEQAQSQAAELLARYLDPGQLSRWKRHAEETVAVSRKSGGVVFVVNKIERTLTVFRGGRKVAVYEIGLGKRGLSDKLHAGDEATPEGRYRVVRKFPDSAFHKALLIDYPRAEDRREFSEARRRGEVPEGATVGGAIEIHGGGKDSLTLGCVGLGDRDMEEVYRWAEIGTPVTIVGALAVEGTILEDVKKFVKNE